MKDNAIKFNGEASNIAMIAIGLEATARAAVLAK